MMKILLAQSMVYIPAHGGANRSNQILLEDLAGRGNLCRAVVPATANQGATSLGGLQEDLMKRGLPFDHSTAGVWKFVKDQVEVHAAEDWRAVHKVLRAQLREFAPDCVIISSEDPAQILLQTAVEESRGKVVYFARTTLALPCGPDAARPDPSQTALLTKASGIVSISNYVREYLRRWANVESTLLHVEPFGAAPFPQLGDFANPFITMINPCAVKGISIFVALSRRFPTSRFAAVATWGTTKDDLKELRSCPNVTLLDPSDNIDDILCSTRILVVPSLWAEARGRIAVEAMLRGIPVIASCIGGIPEALGGVGYLIPVEPITHYSTELDSQIIPRATVPEQDIEPWVRAVDELSSNRSTYNRVATECRQSALEYASQYRVEALDEYLHRLVNGKETPVLQSELGENRRSIQNLSTQTRSLLAERLRLKSARQRTNS
jgi:glycosyltransferase involved in cell wall biosynthesis